MRRIITQLALTLFRGRYNQRSFSKWLVLLFDCCLFFASFWLFVIVKYIYSVDNISVVKHIINYETLHFLPIFIIFIVNVLIFGSYQGLVRYSGFGDIKKIGYVCMGTFILTFMVKTVSVRFLSIA